MLWRSMFQEPLERNLRKRRENQQLMYSVLLTRSHQGKKNMQFVLLVNNDSHPQDKIMFNEVIESVLITCHLTSTVFAQSLCYQKPIWNK